MTLNANPRRAGPYPGTGPIVAYSFDFKIFEPTDLRIVLAVIATGVTTDGVLDSDYSVFMNPDQENNPGGTVSYLVGGIPTALPVTMTLTIVGDLPFTQPMDLTNQGGFYPEVIEDAFDRVTMLIQQNEDGVGRSLQLNPGTDQGFNTELPTPVPNSLIGWNAGGNQLINYDSAATAPVVAAQLAQFIADLANTANAALGDNLIGVKRTDIAGAAALTLHDWNQRDRVNVRQVGVTGDGSTNDATLLNTLGALGVPLFFPYTSSGYKINGAVTFACDVYCEGFFVPDAAIAGAALPQNRFAIVLPSAGFGVGRRFYGIKVQGSGALRTAGVNVIRVDCEDSTLRECRAPVLNYGIVVRSYSVTLDRCSAQLCNVPLAAYARSTSLEINALSIRGGTWDSALIAAMVIGDDSWSDALGSLTLTAAPSAGATSATLSAPWAFPTGPYPVSFFRASDMVKEVRTVNFTSGNTSATWSGGLSAASSSVINVTGGQHGVHIEIGDGVSIDGSELRLDNVSGVKVSLYAEGSNTAQAIRLGGAGDGLLRDVKIGKCYFSALQYAVRCYSAVEGLVQRPSFYTAVSRSALYLVSDIYRTTYERGTNVGSFAQGQEVHTGVRSLSVGAVGFSDLTIPHLGIDAGVQVCVADPGAGGWIPGGVLQDSNPTVRRMNASIGTRFYTSPASACPGTMSSNVFTFTNAADCYRFNGRDRVALAGGTSTHVYVRSVDYAALTMVLDGGANGTATSVSQGTTSFNSTTTTYSGAAPSAGAWARGDRAVNGVAAVASPKAWLCTVAGTPGTWVSEGNL